MAIQIKDDLGGGGKNNQTSSSNTTNNNKGLTQQQRDAYRRKTDQLLEEKEKREKEYEEYLKRKKEEEEQKPYAEQTRQLTELIDQRRDVQQLIQEAELLKSIVLKSGADFNAGYGGQRAILVEGYSNNILSNLDAYIETLKAMDAKLAEEQTRITGENIVPVTDTRNTTERVEINQSDTMYYDTSVLKRDVLPQYENIDTELNQMFDKLMSIGGIGEYDGMSELQNRGLSQIEAMQDSNGRLKDNVQGIVDSVEGVDRENQQRQRKIAERKTTAILEIATREEQEETDRQRELEEQERLARQREYAQKKMDELLGIEETREEYEERIRQEEQAKRDEARRRAANARNKQNQLLGAEGELTNKELEELTDSFLGDYLEPGEAYDRYAMELDQIYLRYAMDGDYSNLNKDINDLINRISKEKGVDDYLDVYSTEPEPKKDIWEIIQKETIDKESMKDIWEEIQKEMAKKDTSEVTEPEELPWWAQGLLEPDVDLPDMQTSMSLGADITNLGVAVLKGFANVGESITDALLIMGATMAGVGSMETGEFVAYQYGERGLTEEDWKYVMGYVADDYVENAYNNFYQNTGFGQTLDENAHGAFKSTGAVTQVAAGLGETAGIATVAALTGGSSLAAGTVAGIAGTGKYTEEHWNNARENAAGGEWATEEIRNQGIFYGVANGVWEGTQYFVGAELNNLKIKKFSDFGNSAARVGIDTTFNAFDTPYRAAVDAATSDKTFQESFEDRGGWVSVITDIGVGLLGSIAGEIMDSGNTEGQDLDDTPSNRTRNNQEPEAVLDDEAKYKFEPKDHSSKEKVELLESLTHRISMSNKTGKELEKILADDDYIVGVCNIGLQDTEDVMKNGLKLTFDHKDGYPDFGSDIYFADNKDIGFQTAMLAFHSTRKGGGRDVAIIRIPKSDFARYSAGEFPTIKNEHILGYLITENNPDTKEKIIKDLIYNENIVEGVPERIPSNITRNNQEPEDVLDGVPRRKSGDIQEPENVLDDITLKNKDAQEPKISTDDILESPIDKNIDKKMKKAAKIIANEKLYKDVDDSLVKQVQVNLMDKHIRGEIDLNKMSKKQLKNYIDTEAINIKNKLREVIRNSDFNKKNLIEGIIETIPKDLDDITKARMIYLKLNQSVTYSDEYSAMLRTIEKSGASRDFYSKTNEIYFRSLDISNLSTNSIVCSNWANLYSDLLIECGIDPAKVKILGANAYGVHRYVQMDLGDGKILIADATTATRRSGLTDLENSKLGIETGGFVITTQEDFFNKFNDQDVRLGMNLGGVELDNVSIKGCKDEIKRIDNVIGYDDKDFTDAYEEVMNFYGNTSEKQMSLEDKMKIYKNMIESKDMSALNMYKISKEYGEQILGIKTNSRYFIEGDKVWAITKIELDDGTVKYMYKVNNSDIIISDDENGVIGRMWLNDEGT